MPVSNPSAFPPPRAGDQIISINGGTNHVGGSVFIAGQSAGDNSTIGDLILIGTNVGSQGWTTAGMEGTVAIGSSVAGFSIVSVSPDLAGTDSWSIQRSSERVMVASGREYSPRRAAKETPRREWSTIGGETGTWP